MDACTVVSAGERALTILPCLFVADILAARCYRVASSDLQKLDWADKVRDFVGCGLFLVSAEALEVTRRVGRYRDGTVVVEATAWKFEGQPGSLDAPATALPSRLSHRNPVSAPQCLSPTKLLSPAGTRVSGAPHAQSQIRGSKIGLALPNFWIIDKSPSTDIDNTAAMVCPNRSQMSARDHD